MDPVRGNDSKACLESPSPSQPCRNLSYAFQYRNSSTQYVLQPGTHYLNSTASDEPFTDLHDIAITGNGGIGLVRVLCFTNNTGLGFDGVQQITLKNVTFTNCAAIQNSTSQNISALPKFELSRTKVALYFNNCKNISMENVHITDSPGASGVTIYNTGGTNNFMQCNFSGNIARPDDLYPGGGGMYIEFSYCLPGRAASCDNSTDSNTDNNKQSTYTFTNCTFVGNQASTGATNATASTFIVPYKRNHVAFSRGGGLSLFFKANASGNTFTITGCTFKGNTAIYGAGMFAEFHDTSGGNKVIVNGITKFVSNVCQIAGGGMRLGHYVYGTTVASEGNTVEVHKSTFSDNTAASGGGLSISPTRQNSDNMTQLFSALVELTTFEYNCAKYGAALRVELYSLIVRGSKPNITLSGCFFFNNTVYLTSYTKPQEVGVGTVYITQVNVFLIKNIFLYNHGSALALVATSTHFLNTTYFLTNDGIHGGAIALLGSSRIIINQTSQLFFVDNSADEGGAIYNKYTDKNNYKDSSECFIAHYDAFVPPDEWGAEFQFVKNTDSMGQNAIYSTSILPCAITGGRGQATVRQILCWDNWTYDGGRNCSDYIRTGPGNVTNERASPISRASEGSNEIHIPAFSGQLIPLYLRAVDDLNHTLPVAYRATVNSSQPSYTGAKVDPNYSYVSQNVLSVFQYGPNGTNATVHLNAVGDRAWNIDLKIELQDCPPGLQPTNINCDDTSSDELCLTCKCNSKVANYSENIQCNTPSNASLASGYWMGRYWEGECSNEMCFVVAQCPSGLCRSSKSEFIPLPQYGLNEHICGPQNRTGVLCGKCIDGYGPALNSETYDCVSCNVSNHRLAVHATYYILAVYVPLFLLFLAIIVFNIKLTTGPANAFILYSQVISSTFDLNADGKIFLGSVIPNINYYLTAYKFPYGIFNLEFFEQFIPSESLCLGTQLKVLDILLLEYIVAFSPLLMIIGVVLVYKMRWRCSCYVAKGHRYRNSGRCKACRTRLGNALLPAFASFVLLSYTKFSLTSSYITVTTSLHDATGYPMGTERVYYAGYLSTTDRHYRLFYQTPSIFIFLTFVAIPPLLLLDYPLWFLEEKIIRRVPRLYRRYPKDKIHIMLDTFQGCYKDRWRCFAGLYFVFRLVINITYIYSDLLLQFMFQGMYSMLLAILVAYLKPYRREFHICNYVDSVIFLNLAIINQITFYLYSYTRNGTPPPVAAFAVQYILVFLPLLYMVSYTVWCVLPIPNVRSRAKEWLAKRQQTQQMANLIENRTSATPEPTEDEIDWERAQEVNSYSPILHVTEHSDTAGNTRGKGSADFDSGLAVNSASSDGKTTRQTYGSMGNSRSPTALSNTNTG